MSQGRDRPVQKWDSSQVPEATDDVRLAGDRELYQILRSEGFSGRNFEEFVGVLIQYGVAVVRGWAFKGELVGKCRSRNVRGLPASDPLSNSSVGEARRLELVYDIVADGIINFTDTALKGGRWTPGGGASMKTFFIGACLFAAAPHLARLSSELEIQKRRVTLEQDASGAYLGDGTEIDLADSSGDIAEKVVARMIAQDLYDDLSSTDRKLLDMKARGAPRKEIARAIGSTPKGVDSRVARIRRKWQEERKEAG